LKAYALLASEDGSGDHTQDGKTGEVNPLPDRTRDGLEEKPWNWTHFYVQRPTVSLFMKTLNTNFDVR
jgi:hypothetical protein